MSVPYTYRSGKSASTTTLDSLFSSENRDTTLTNTPIDTPLGGKLPEYREITEHIKRKLQSKTVVLLMGLPGAGKSTLTEQLCQHLGTSGYKALVYNAGNVRRAMSTKSSDSEFFSPNNVEAKKMRDIYARMCVDNMLEDLKENRINVGFMDATNSTKERRRSILTQIYEAGIEISNVFILHVSCTDEALLHFNVTNKAFNPDYIDKDVFTSISDFKKRMLHYSQIFEPFSQDELDGFRNARFFSFCNGGEQVQMPTTLPPDQVTGIFTAFLKSYHKSHGKQYRALVDQYRDI